MIAVQHNPTADTRTCDYTKVTKDELEAASVAHIREVYLGLRFLQECLEERARLHDWDKVSKEGLEHFFSDFQTGFKETGWYKKHLAETRHHPTIEGGLREDINLIDVLEQIVDSVMAGMARSGEVRLEPIAADVLERAYANTIELMKAEVAAKPKAERGRG